MHRVGDEVQRKCIRCGATYTASRMVYDGLMCWCCRNPRQCLRDQIKPDTEDDTEDATPQGS